MSDRNPASERRPGAPRRRATGAWGVVAALLGVGIVLPLLVGLYDSESPTLWGFPFFYWFQFALIPVVSLFTYVAFRLSLRATAHDREAIGLPAEPTGDREGER